MIETKKQIEEPFKTAVERRSDYNPNIDYKLNAGKSDHEWLTRHGFKIDMGSDCAYYLKKDGAFFGGLTASSYGDWGSYFCGFDKDDAGLDLLLGMYDDNIIDLWRIRVYINRQCYDYNKDSGKWTTVIDGKLQECPSPFV